MMWSGSRSEVTEMHELSEPGGGAGAQMYGELCVIMAVMALFAKKGRVPVHGTLGERKRKRKN